jgi:hypothetical protein
VCEITTGFFFIFGGKNTAHYFLERVRNNVVGKIRMADRSYRQRQATSKAAQLDASGNIPRGPGSQGAALDKGGRARDERSGRPQIG